MQQILLAAAVFFHKGDGIPAYEFQHAPCMVETVYIQGLDEAGWYAVSNESYLYEDRAIFHLNPTFTHFKLYDTATNTLQATLNIRWKTDCDRSIEAPATSISAVSTTMPISAFTSRKTLKTTPRLTTVPHTAAEVQNTTPHVKKDNLILQSPSHIEYYIGEPMNILQDIYLFTDTQEDMSHLLTYKSFDPTIIGTQYVEVQGIIEQQKIQKIVRVEIKEQPKPTVKVPVWPLIGLCAIWLSVFLWWNNRGRI